MKILIAIVLLAVITLLGGCNTPNQQDKHFTFLNLGYLSIGDSPEIVEKVLKKNNIAEVASDNEGFVQIYQRPLWPDGGGVMITGYDYVLAYYINKKLIYWGHIDDFLNHKDSDIYNAGIVAGQKLKEVLDEL